MLNQILVTAATGWVILFVMMVALWILQRAIHNAAVVDVGWGFAFVVLAVVHFAMLDGDMLRRGLACAMMGLHGLRLGVYLLFARVIGHEEEGRYVDLRREWGSSAEKRLFFFFQFQAIVAVLMSLVIVFPGMNARPGFGAWEIIGVTLWFVAVTGEWLSDAQLARFKARKDRTQKVCREGLWGFSRHPNYFFQALLWVAFAVYASASPWGWLAWFAPLTMLYFLLRVTGIPATEAQALRTKGDEYRRYQDEVSAFVPWIPKRTGDAA